MNMSDLSIRFLGSSTDRLIRIVGISHGMNLETGLKLSLRDLLLNFPQGNLKERKALVVSEGKVENLKTTRVADVVFKDTFGSGRSRRRY
jgi:hypothetical protein